MADGRLRIGIDSRWSAQEFSKFFEEVEIVAGIANGETYKSLRGGHGKFEDNKDGTIKMTEAPYFGTLPLHLRPTFISVSQIQFRSPGWIDLVGIGKCVEQIRLFLEFVINTVVNAEDRRLDREEKRLRLQNERIRLIENFQKSGLHPEMLNFIEASEADGLLTAISDGRVTSTQKLDNLGE